MINRCTLDYKYTPSKMTSSASDLCEILIEAFNAGVASVQPFDRVKDILQPKNGKLSLGDYVYNLNRNIHLVAFGKAALGMVKGAESSLGKDIVEGIASVPRGTLKDKSINFELKTSCYEGATNNLPDNDALQTAERIEKLAEKLNDSNDIFLVLISGGGSALLPAPIHSITLREKLETIDVMTKNGADIKQLNSIRRVLSRLKGGKLALLAYPAKVISIIISDIIGDPIDLVASGPTVLYEPNDAMNSIQILEELGIHDQIPLNALKILSDSNMQNIFHHENIHVQNLLVANNEMAVNEIKHFMETREFQCYIASTNICDNARDYGNQLANLIRILLPKSSCNETTAAFHMIKDIDFDYQNSDKFAIVFAGECTVQITGNGKGGRNQEIALAALSNLLAMDRNTVRNHFALLSAGTDGQDGPTNVAGAIITDEDLSYIWRNNELIRNAVDTCLNHSDSYNFWKNFRDGACHFKTGPTGTNVMDLQIIIIKKWKY